MRSGGYRHDETTPEMQLLAHSSFWLHCNEPGYRHSGIVQGLFVSARGFTGSVALPESLFHFDKQKRRHHPTFNGNIQFRQECTLRINVLGEQVKVSLTVRVFM